MHVEPDPAERTLALVTGIFYFTFAVTGLSLSAGLAILIIGIPIVQLVLFGYAINSDPKHLPTAINVQDPSVYSRTLVRALEIVQAEWHWPFGVALVAGVEALSP